MTPPRWYSPTTLARASGLPERHIRYLLDRRRLTFVQYAPNEKRLLNDATVADLEALGVPVDRAVLHECGESGDVGEDGEDGEIRAQHARNGQ